MSKQLFKKEKIYYNIYLRFTFLIFVTIMFLSSILCFQFENTLKYQLYSSEQLKLQQASYSAKLLTDYLISLSKQIYFDRDINLLRVIDNLNYEEKIKALKQLQHYKTMTDFVTSIYVYNSKNETIYIADKNGTYSMPSTIDRDLSVLIENYYTYKPLKPIPRLLPIITNYNDTIYMNGYTLLFYEDRGISDKPLSNAIIVNVAEEWMQEMIDELNTTKNSNVFIINTEGKTLNSTSEHSMFYDLSDKNYISSILSSTKKDGYFVQEIDGKKSLVVYSNYQEFDWVYVSVISYTSIIKNINQLRIIVIFIAFIILLIGLIIAFFQTRSVYNPIALVMNQNKIKHSNKLIERNSFLKGLLLNTNILKYEILLKELENFDFCVKENMYYFLSLITIDHYNAFYQNNNVSDRNLCVFSIANISSEALGAHFKNDYIDVENNSVVIIVSHPTSLLETDIIMDAIRLIQTNVRQYFDLSVTVTISTMTNSIKKMPLLYNEVLALCNYKFYSGYQSILFSHDITERNNDDTFYPIELEQQFFDNLTANNIPKAKQLFNNIFSNASNISYITLKLTINHFAFGLNNAIGKIEKNTGVSLQYNLYEFVRVISMIETLDETVDAFNQLFDTLDEKLNSRDNDKYEKIVRTVISKVEKDYSDINLSVTYLADYVDLSAPYLGKIFKQITGSGLPDYINDIRLIKAAEFLISTKLTVKEIIDLTGFTSSQYFHKLFKKKHIVTPNQFRKNYHKRNTMQ